jgi:hypothetical protein
MQDQPRPQSPAVAGPSKPSGHATEQAHLQYGTIEDQEQDHDSEDRDLENQEFEIEQRDPCDFSSWSSARYSVGRYFFLVLLFYSGVYFFWTPQLWW